MPAETLTLTVQDRGRWVKARTLALFENGRIEFPNAPFVLKDELKAMSGAKWHGFDEPPRKCWSIKDCPRNRFQLDYLRGIDVYRWFERPLIRHDYSRPLKAHQRDMADAGLTYHYQIFAAGMGVGKTLAAQEIIERGGQSEWLWVGPKSTLVNIKREFAKWGWDSTAGIHIEWLSYEGLKSVAKQLFDSNCPGGVIFDEGSRLKNAASERSSAAQTLADTIRQVHGTAGYVILMSGTPSPKTPVDWWSECEICWPGFLREGSPKSLEKRLAYLTQGEAGGQVFNQRVGWRDSEHKCDTCGALRHEPHDGHDYKPSINEVAKLSERLAGLVVVKHKQDCLDLPEKHYRVIELEPDNSLARLISAIVQSAPNTITALTQLRELSDGFIYREERDGEMPCPHCDRGQIPEWVDSENPDLTFTGAEFLAPDIAQRLVKRLRNCYQCDGSLKIPRLVRTARQVPCPKDQALKDLLDENADTGRLVVFAGFTGSVDRVQKLCESQGWCVVRCDGRGMQTTGSNGRLIAGEPLDYWSDLGNEKVAFVAHPESGGMSFTLTEARMAVFWSNSFKPEYRIQAEDRIHRLGMDENRGATIVDLLHLPQDRKVLEVIRANRRLELMTLGELGQAA